MRLTSQTWTDLVDEAPSVICIPVGSCEQHGPHLPLDTDTVVAEALAAGLAERRARVLVGPSLTVTASGEHAGFPGTLSIGSSVLADVLVELARSADWAAGLVLVNGHGGNRHAVDAAIGTIAAEGRAALAWWPSIPDGDAHAGLTETALMLALDPTAVRLERAAAGSTEPIERLADRLRTEGVRAVSPNGVLGDPAGATAPEGAGIFDAMAQRLLAQARRLLDAG